MVAYLDKVKALTMKIKDFKIQQISREENKQVDVLANLASTFDFVKDRNTPLEFLQRPSIDVAKTNFYQTTMQSIQMEDIAKYLRNGELSFDKL